MRGGGSEKAMADLTGKERFRMQVLYWLRYSNITPDRREETANGDPETWSDMSQSVRCDNEPNDSALPSTS